MSADRIAGVMGSLREEREASAGSKGMQRFAEVLEKCRVTSFPNSSILVVANHMPPGSLQAGHGFISTLHIHVKTVRAVGQWNGLPQEAADSLSFEVS